MEKLVIVISHDELLAKKYHDYLYEIKDYQLHLIHQNVFLIICLKTYLSYFYNLFIIPFAAHSAINSFTSSIVLSQEFFPLYLLKLFIMI